MSPSTSCSPLGGRLKPALRKLCGAESVEPKTYTWIHTWLAVFCTLCLLSGCSGEPDPKAENQQPARLTLFLSNEPASLNTILSEDNTSYEILDHITEGLLVFDRNNQLAPGVAERWEFDPTRGGTFYLRDDARWNDGSPVLAEDFVFAWREALNPASGSGYAYILYPIKNAEAINRGQQPVSDLGVTALDSHTLRVELERPTPYFLSLTAFSVYRPIKESFYRNQGQRYAANTDNILYNGPFIMQRWVHGAEILLRKNPHYWNRNAIAIDEIHYAYFTSDANTIFNLFRDGKIMMSGLLPSSIDSALSQRMHIRSKPPGRLTYLGFNLRGNSAITSLSLRRAIQAIINRRELIDRVLGIPGVDNARSFFPKSMKSRFNDGYTLYQSPTLDEKAIMQLLAEAKQELDVKEIPPISLLIEDQSAVQTRMGEYLQDAFKRLLGIELLLDRQAQKQLLARMSKNDYEIALGSWAPDYDDPQAYAEVLISRSGDGGLHYRHPQLEANFEIAATSIETSQRNTAFRELHRLVARDVPILPLFFADRASKLLYLQDPRLEGVRRSAIAGDPNYNYARLTPP